MTGRAWTAEETSTLADIYPREGITAALAALPGRGQHAIEQRAHKLGLRSPIVAAAPKPLLDGDQLERAIHLYEVERWPMARIARAIGAKETATGNAVLIALCPRRGYRPAERDPAGRLTPESKERIRYMLKKGMKHVAIQLRLGLSSARIAEERRRYNADLAARGKAPLPPPGGGEQYCGVKIPLAKRREVEAALMLGNGSPTVAHLTGISVPSVKNIRRRLVARLARKGEALPGCDRDGRRVTAAKASPHYIPDTAGAELRRRLLAGEPVQPAARACGIGQCGAYRIRNQLAAELAERGEALPNPQRRGRGEGFRAASRETDWLPAGRIREFRALTHEHGFADAKHILLGQIEQERQAAAAARAAERARPKSFEEQLAAVAAGTVRLVPKFVIRRPDPSMTLGGVASGALA